MAVWHLQCGLIYHHFVDSYYIDVDDAVGIIAGGVAMHARTHGALYIFEQGEHVERSDMAFERHAHIKKIVWAAEAPSRSFHCIRNAHRRTCALLESSHRCCNVGVAVAQIGAN